MWNFINQWSIGLQPSLNLSMEVAGSISIRLDVISSRSPLISEPNWFYPKRRRSGQQSRSRRRILHAQARQSLEPIDTSIVAKDCDPILTASDASEKVDCTANYYQDINHENTIFTSITEDQDKADQEYLNLEFGDSMSEDVLTDNTSEQIDNCDQEVGKSEPSWSEILKVIEDMTTSFNNRTFEHLLPTTNSPL